MGPLPFLRSAGRRSWVFINQGVNFLCTRGFQSSTSSFSVIIASFKEDFMTFFSSKLSGTVTIRPNTTKNFPVLPAIKYQQVFKSILYIEKRNYYGYLVFYLKNYRRNMCGVSVISILDQVLV
jgi:hypothetical protein